MCVLIHAYMHVCACVCKCMYVHVCMCLHVCMKRGYYSWMSVGLHTKRHWKVITKPLGSSLPSGVLTPLLLLKQVLETVKCSSLRQVIETGHYPSPCPLFCVGAAHKNDIDFLVVSLAVKVEPEKENRTLFPGRERTSSPRGI